MALTFDHSLSRINVPAADAQPLTMQALINAIRAHEASERGITEPYIADASGKEDLGGGVLTGITVSLRSSWVLYFQPGAYQAKVDGGNLSDALARIYNTGNPQVLVLASAAGTIVDSGGGSGGSAPTSEEISDAVWDESFGTLTARQVMELLKASLTDAAVRINGMWYYKDPTTGDLITSTSLPVSRGMAATTLDLKSSVTANTSRDGGGVERVVVSTKKIP